MKTAAADCHAVAGAAIHASRGRLIIGDAQQEAASGIENAGCQRIPGFSCSDSSKVSAKTTARTAFVEDFGTCTK